MEAFGTFACSMIPNARVRDVYEYVAIELFQHNSQYSRFAAVPNCFRVCPLSSVAKCTTQINDM
jgi:hypothetical protein